MGITKVVLLSMLLIIQNFQGYKGLTDNTLVISPVDIVIAGGRRFQSSLSPQPRNKKGRDSPIEIIFNTKLSHTLFSIFFIYFRSSHSTSTTTATTSVI